MISFLLDFFSRDAQLWHYYIIVMRLASHFASLFISQQTSEQILCARTYHTYHVSNNLYKDAIVSSKRKFLFHHQFRSSCLDIILEATFSQYIHFRVGVSVLKRRGFGVRVLTRGNSYATARMQCLFGGRKLYGFLSHPYIKSCADTMMRCKNLPKCSRLKNENFIYIEINLILFV